MATTAQTSSAAVRRFNVRGLLQNPATAPFAAIGYTVVIVLIAASLNRTALWYPTLNMIIVPLMFFSPLIIISANMNRRFKMTVLILTLLVLMPLIGIYNTSWLELAIQVSIFAGLALGLNVVVGFAGLLDLGYVAFFALGAYLWAVFASSPQTNTVFAVNGLLVTENGLFFIFLVLGVIVAGVAGILLGLPVLRLRGDYLAIVTLGFGEMIRVIARNLGEPVNITNGSQGLHGIQGPPVPEILRGFVAGTVPQTLGIRLENPDAVAKQLFFYLLALLVVVLCITVARRLQDSPIGRAWTAIREDEVAAIAMGVPLVRMKLLAFASGASFAGAIGVLYAAKQTFIDPNSFLLVQSISILAMVIVGGLGSIKGVILGATIVTLLDLHVLQNLSIQLNSLRNAGIVNFPTQLEPAKYQPLVFGFILVIMMIFRPAGLLPEARRKMELVVDDDDVDVDADEPPSRKPASGQEAV